MKNYSIWLENKEKEKFKSIDKDEQADVLIIGGGITGLTLLYQLKKSNLKTILVEKNYCGEGVTSKSTAKITFLQENICQNIRKYVGIDQAKMYLKSQIDAIDYLKQIITTEQIACDLNPVSSYLFTINEKNNKKIDEEMNFLKECGIKVEKVNPNILVSNAKAAIKVDGTYEFHPIKYLEGLKQILKDDIFEQSKVEKVEKIEDGYLCFVNDHQIKVKYVVFTCHYPYFLNPFWLPFKSHVETSYIGAAKTDEWKPITAINIEQPTISFRYYKAGNQAYLIALYRSFISCNVKDIKKNFNDLQQNNSFEYLWSNKDIITNDYMPYIGSITSNNTLLLATGYNTWGMTNGPLAAKIISDIILKKDNPYIILFSPNRSINVSKMLRFPLDVGCSIKAIIKGNTKNCNNQQIKYEKKDGKKVAIYVDEKGKEHVVYHRCPHMKCGLIFNEVEKTWDCHCHGSRFDIDGHCFEGPSLYDISANKKSNKK